MKKLHLGNPDRLIVVSAVGLCTLLLCSIWLSRLSLAATGFLISAFVLWAAVLGASLFAALRPVDDEPSDAGHPEESGDRLVVWAYLAGLACAGGFVVAAAWSAPPPLELPGFNVTSLSSLGLMAIGVGAFVASLRESRLRNLLRLVGVAFSVLGASGVGFTVNINDWTRELLKAEMVLPVPADPLELLADLELKEVGRVVGFAPGETEAHGGCEGIGFIVEQIEAIRPEALLLVGHADQVRLRPGRTEPPFSNRQLAAMRSKWMGNCLDGHFDGPIIHRVGGPLNLGVGLAEEHYAEDRLVEVVGIVKNKMHGQDRTLTFTLAEIMVKKLEAEEEAVRVLLGAGG